jgi:predicted XRE-type DNA-binding protein
LYNTSVDSQQLKFVDSSLDDLRRFINTRKLTQSEAAEILGMSQSRVSDFMRGKWEKFSLEMMIMPAKKAGMHVISRIAA